MSDTPNGNHSPTESEEALRAEQIRIATRILGLSEDNAVKRSQPVEGSMALYVAGFEGAVIVDTDSSHLFAQNDVSKAEHLRAFRDGQRGNYAPPEETKDNTSVITWSILVVIVLLVLGGLLFVAFSDDDDDVGDPNYPDDDATTTQTAEPTEETTEPEPTETETAEPAPTVTETETAEPAPEPEPTDEETMPTAEPPVNGEDEDPADLSVDATFPDEIVIGEELEVSGSLSESQDGTTIEVYVVNSPGEDIEIDSVTSGEGETDFTVNGVVDEELELDETVIVVDAGDFGELESDTLPVVR